LRRIARHCCEPRGGPWVLLDGELVPARRPAVSALDRALFPGLGLFETTRIYDGRPFRLRQHLRRMRAGARRLGLRCPFDDERLARDVDRLIEANGARGAALRLFVTSGGPGVRPSVIGVLDHLRRIPASVWSRGAAAEIAPCVRDPRSPLAGVKSLNYLEGRILRAAARRRGAHDAIYLSPDGRLLEGTSCNLFAVIGGQIATPPLMGILPGVTRACVMELLGAVRERSLRIADLRRASEVFLTSSLVEVLPLSKIGPVRLPRRGFPVARDLWRRYRALAYNKGT
jgi:branched-subunit amino acid aminotransferase/4-amino-4-deoxychorismate lyase